MQDTKQEKATDIVRLARHTKRPTTLDYIKFIINDFLELHGDRRYGDDPAIVGGIGFLKDIPVTIIGHQKGKNVKENVRRNFGMAHPEGYRKALRLMEEAERFGRPVINFIDTPGAYPGIGAEERGQAEAIAYNLYKMSSLAVPIISIITGEGGSGGALALGVADRVYMLSDTIYSVISPEGCASILWRDSAKTDDAAEALKLTAKDLLEFKIIDGIINEPAGGAQKDHENMARRIKTTLLSALSELLSLDCRTLLNRRYDRYRRMGKFTED
ncbi:MAG: acetyl-CoA carboxylase carboxyltransferase subunit alpha [Candidatus Aminicenantes bacterium]|jgi:acetyl-CoA carboxylase carboxyl transferase subunit alpha|nr:acetyl-CoA carboxylase carboxyltransferase subunit alpha [Candidatus Aminicenantes bacterium]